jgi:hypothetical protein
VGTMPSSMVTGNFNGDAFTDLAVASVGNDNIAIKLGDGSGGFSGTGTVSTGANSDPRAIAAGDFDNDGKTDLISANSGNSTVSIMLGDGAGGFTSDASPENVAGTAASPVSIAVGRFENPMPAGTPDPTLDAIITSQASDQVLTLLGDGSGGFAGSGTNYTAPISTMNPDPSAVAVGSLNPGSPDPANAAEPDLLIANQGLENVFPAYGFSNGSAFEIGGPVATGTDPVAVAFGDLNGDGNPDGITANRGAGTATIIISDGNGGTTADASPAVGSSPDAVVTGAFDADGLADAAVANHDSNSVSILTSMEPGPPPAGGPGTSPLPTLTGTGFPPCASLRHKLRKAKRAHNTTKVRKLKKKLRKLGC